MSLQTANDNILRLRHQGGGQLLVEPEDQDRFFIGVEKAIEACRRHMEKEQYRRQFSLLVKRLGNWLGEHEAKVEDAYLTVRDDSLLFLVVRKEVAYDPEFTDQLTHFDFEIVDDPELDLISMSVLALPQCEQSGVDSFIDSKLRMRFVRENA